jgi:hypothetical protein
MTLLTFFFLIVAMSLFPLALMHHDKTSPHLLMALAFLSFSIAWVSIIMILSWLLHGVFLLFWS